MDSVVSYAKTVLFFLLFVNLVIQLLQGSSYERFIRPVCGMILIILVIRPMLRLFGEDERVLFAAEQKLSLLLTKNDMAMAEPEEDSYTFVVLEQYEAELTRQLEEVLQKEGLEVISADFSISAEEKEFGVIRGIAVTAGERQAERESNIYIAPIVFERNQAMATMSAREIGIRDKLSDFYRLEKDNIYVSIKEEEDG